MGWDWVWSWTVRVTIQILSASSAVVNEIHQCIATYCVRFPIILLFLFYSTILLLELIGYSMSMWLLLSYSLYCDHSSLSFLYYYPIARSHCLCIIPATRRYISRFTLIMFDSTSSYWLTDTNIIYSPFSVPETILCPFSPTESNSCVNDEICDSTFKSK